MKQPINIQDQFLNQLRKEAVPVTVFLLNGFQLRGQVKGFDNFTILFESEGKQQLVYKHAFLHFLHNEMSKLIMKNKCIRKKPSYI